MTLRWRLLFSVLVVILAGACVPNRKLVYLQNEDVNKSGIASDSVLRNYDMDITQYRIQPLDLLYIKVESLTPEDFDFVAKLDPAAQQTSAGSSGGGGGGGSIFALRYGYLVDTDGELEYPVIGKIKVGGLTVFETQNLLTTLFRPHLTLPAVRVRLLNFRFTILGEVNLEQQITLTNTRVTLMEGIGMAGGLTDLADRANVKIVRQNKTNSEVFYLNLLDEKLLLSSNYYIHQNDVIIVPPLKQRPFRKYFGQNLTLFLITFNTLLLIATLLNYKK